MRGHGVRVAAKIFFNKKMEGNETFERGNYNTLKKSAHAEYHRRFRRAHRIILEDPKRAFSCGIARVLTSESRTFFQSVLVILAGVGRPSP